MFLMKKGVGNLWHQGCMDPQAPFLKPPEPPISQLLKIIRSFPFQVGNSHASPPENHSLLCVVHSYTLYLDAQTTVTFSSANMTKPAPTSQKFLTPIVCWTKAFVLFHCGSDCKIHHLQLMCVRAYHPSWWMIRWTDIGWLMKRYSTCWQLINKLMHFPSQSTDSIKVFTSSPWLTTGV